MVEKKSSFISICQMISSQCLSSFYSSEKWTAFSASEKWFYILACALVISATICRAALVRWSVDLGLSLVRCILFGRLLASSLLELMHILTEELVHRNYCRHISKYPSTVIWLYVIWMKLKQSAEFFFFLFIVILCNLVMQNVVQFSQRMDLLVHMVKITLDPTLSLTMRWICVAPKAFWSGR